MDNRLVFWIDTINTWLGKAFGWSIVFLTAATSYEVFARYVLNAPTDWAFDAAYILYGTLFMMAGAYTLARNSHVRGDWIYRNWSPSMQAKSDLILYFIFFFPGIVTLFYIGWDYAAYSWSVKERSLFTPAGPIIYPFKTIIPIAGFMLIMQGVAEVLRCVYCIKHGYWPPRLGDVEELEQVLQKQYATEDAPAGEVRK